MCCDRYAARMKTQTIINCVFAVAFVAYVVWSRNPTFDNITCKGWKVVDEDGKERIVTGTDQFGFCSVAFVDQNKKMRISAGTRASGLAGVGIFDMDGKSRIAALSFADGVVMLPTHDWESNKDAKVEDATELPKNNENLQATPNP